MDDATLFEDTVLCGTAMRRVNATSIQISQEQINSTFGDASVILPDDIPRPAHWPDWTLPIHGRHAVQTEWRKWQDNPDGYPVPKNPDP